MARSDNTSFNIEVLEGSSAGLIIPLEGRSAPYGGADGSISFGVSQRTKLVWNQGNPVATQLIFGPTLDPTSINGTWKERYLGTDVPIDLVETFESLCSRGLQCRVSWSTIERIGVVKSFSWIPGNPTGGLGDIAWNMTFEWSRSGGLNRLFVPTAGLAKGPVRNGLADIANRFGTFRSGLNDIIAEVGSFAGTLRRTAATTVNQWEQALDQGEALVNFVTDVASRFGGTEDESAELLEQGSMSTDAIIDNVHDTQEVTGGADPLRTIDKDDVESILNLALLLAGSTDDAYDLIEAAYQLQTELEAELTPEAEVEIPAVAGEDLRKIAFAFYGSADDWVRIAKANGITEGSTIPTDLSTLVIPLGLPAALDDRIGGC